MKFICPSCKAENTTEHVGNGCALCGYGRASAPLQPSSRSVQQQTEVVCHECNQPQSKCGGSHYLRG